MNDIDTAYLGAMIGTAWREMNSDVTTFQASLAYRAIMEELQEASFYFRATLIHTLHKHCAFCGTLSNVKLTSYIIYACEACNTLYNPTQSETYKRLVQLLEEGTQRPERTHHE